jgi:hypothetical protein
MVNPNIAKEMLAKEALVLVVVATVLGIIVLDAIAVVHLPFAITEEVAVLIEVLNVIMVYRGDL